MHLIRQGRFELADTFIRVCFMNTALTQESGVEIPPELQYEFRMMYEILQAIQARNLRPAIEFKYSCRANIGGPTENVQNWNP
jgi:hypothetical protein